jgi:phage major head subunit gpT-like protein
MQINQATLDAIFRQFSLDYQAAYEETETWKDQLATTIPSSTRENTYGWLAQLPGMREWLGPRVAVNLRAHDHTIVNRDFEHTIEVDRNKILDDQLGVFKMHTKMQGEAVKKHPDELLTELIQGNGVCFDGLPFFDTAHPEAPGEAGSPTYSNDFTTLPLEADGVNYQVVRAAMASRNGDGGRVLKVRPSLLAVPPQLEDIGRKLLRSGTIIDPGGGAAVDNIWQGSAELLVVPEWANEPTRWYLFDTSRAIKPFVYQERQPPTFVSRQNPQDPSVFNEKKFLFGVDSRDNSGFSLPFLASRATA